ncbi:MAG: hypothetical protein WCF76_06690, partial [Pseudolabrys sp.]
MKRSIHCIGRRASPFAGKQMCEELGVAATTFKTRPMARCKSRHFVEEKQFRVEAAPYIALAILEFEHATDPLPGCPASAGQRPIGGVKPATAITQQRS